MPDFTEHESELNRIFEKILVLCESATQDGNTYLLSKLGKDLGKDLDMYRSLTGEKLADFLRRKLPTQFAIASTGIHNNILEIVRLSSRAGVSFESSVISRPERPAIAQIPRFNYRFWAAFAVPLAAGARRYLDLTKLTFRDVNNDDPPTSDERAIPSEMIPSEDCPNRSTIILGNVTRWIEANGLNKADFVERKPRHDVEKPLGGISVLELMISSLDQRQLQAAALSLDIVSTLLKKKI